MHETGENVTVKHGDALALLDRLDPGSIDLVFADPPYNLSGTNHQTCRGGKMRACNKGEWDQIDDIHGFNRAWIEACMRVMKPGATIWISGTLHNHPVIGVVLKELGLWIINDVVWYKRNAPPLMQRNRLVPSTELIWVAAKSKKYYFDYDLARRINGGKQMRNLWEINAQRHITSHPTEKPESLLERIVLIGSKEGDLVVDPFLGSGTTGVVAKRLGRKFIGFEIDESYFAEAENRISGGMVIDDVTAYAEGVSTYPILGTQTSLKLADAVMEPARRARGARKSAKN
ncbi:MAG: site-specific DNA-methyltransferase [Chitinivibrionales bacterium]|nr:site-specific DNA-methyltransferase [Chitinivibrionales bacterium]MBD3394283.1 site-specific DNA-methyltransferase [Chitinivibrionales bacterium]